MQASKNIEAIYAKTGGGGTHTAGHAHKVPEEPTAGGNATEDRKMSLNGVSLFILLLLKDDFLTNVNV
jgi:hypothetical protein